MSQITSSEDAPPSFSNTSSYLGDSYATPEFSRYYPETPANPRYTTAPRSTPHTSSWASSRASTDPQGRRPQRSPASISESQGSGGSSARTPPPLASHRQEVSADHLEALGQPPPTLPMVLTAAPDLWPAAAAQLPAGVKTPAGAPPLTIRHIVFLIWLLRRCRAWQLITGHPPSIPLPPASSPGKHPALILCALESTKAEAVSLLRQAPAALPLVVLASATVVDYLQPRHHEPLTLLPLPDGHIVGRPLGAPLHSADGPDRA